MFITASKIYGLPVASLESSSKIGEVGFVYFSPDDLSIIALEVNQGFFLFRKKLYLASSDIIELDKKGVVIKNQEVLVTKDEIVRIQKMIKDKTPIYGQRAITKSNKYLGKVVDLLIDTGSFTICKLYIDSMLVERILPADKIEKITPKAIVFSDDVIEGIPIAKADEAMA